MRKYTAVAVEHPVLHLIRELSSVTGETHSGLVARLINEELDRRGGMVVFNPKESYENLLKDIDGRLSTMERKSFEAINNINYNIAGLAAGLRMIMEKMAQGNADKLESLNTEWESRIPGVWANHPHNFDKMLGVERD